VVIAGFSSGEAVAALLAFAFRSPDARARAAEGIERFLERLR
jgi:hypothetical protein